MKIISVDLARVVRLFPLSEINPEGKSLSRVISSCADRYGFKKAPQHMMDFDSENALTFEGGDFKNKAGKSVVVKLRIYSDGFVGDSWSSTKDSDDFLESLMRWLHSEHGLGLPPDRQPKRLFLSQLTVTTDRQLLTLNPAMIQIADELSSKLDQLGIQNPGFNFGSIGLWSNNPIEKGAIAQFRFENKAGTLPAEKRYFTQAPLTTEAHLSILESFEKILGHPQRSRR